MLRILKVSTRPAIFLFIITLVLSAVVSTSVFAQELGTSFLEGIQSEADSNNLTEEQQELDEYFANSFDDLLGEGEKVVTLVATTEVYDAKIVNQNGRTITTTFDLFNEQGIQSDLIYGVRLIKVTDSDTSSYVADYIAHPETFSMGENVTMPITFTFTVPNYLAGGEYYAEIQVSNSAGLNLAFAPLDIFLIADSTGLSNVVIDGSTCMLYVAGEEDITYGLRDGVDVDTDEMLKLKCVITNLSPTELALTPRFETYRRLIETNVKAGAVAELASQTVAIPAEGTAELDIQIPLAQTPQAYDTDVYLTDATGTQVSNSIITHYVVRGLSGTLQNIVLDKEVYAAGDTAAVKVIYSLAADAFPDSRDEAGGTMLGDLTIEVQLVDMHGNVCAEHVTAVVTGDLVSEEFSIPVTNNCVQAAVTTRLLQTDSGTLLDEVLPTSQTVKSTTNSSQSERDDNQGLIWLILIVGLLLIGTALYFKLRNQSDGSNDNDTVNKTNTTNTTQFVDSLTAVLFFVGVLGFSFFTAGVERVEAAVFSFSAPGVSVYATYSINKKTFAPGDTLKVSASMTIAGCTNHVSGGVLVKPNKAGGWVGVVSFPYLKGTNYFSGSRSFTVKNSWQTNNIAAFTIGSYNVKGLSYTVPVINGSCGSSKNSCTAGSFSDTSDNSTAYLWNCNSQNGGSNASCSVPITCSSGALKTWTVSGHVCTGVTPLSNGGSSGAISDTTSPTKGEASFSCSASGWSASPTAGATCSASPVVTTDTVTGIGSDTMTLNATGNPNGASATGWFRYSSTDPGVCNNTFGTRAPSVGGTAIGVGNTAVSFLQSISSLSPNTVYYYCSIASNVNGTGYGPVLSAKTKGLNLHSNITPTLNSGILTQGQDVTFGGQVLSDGYLDVTTNFSDNFTYCWVAGCSPSTMIDGHISEGPLAIGSTRNDVSSALTLDDNGILRVKHCIDSEYNQVESDETVADNCETANFTVTPPPSVILNASDCEISLGTDTCNINVAWDSIYTIPTRKITRNGIDNIGLNNISDDNIVGYSDINMSKGTYIYRFYDSSKLTPLGTNVAIAACVTNASMNDVGVCQITPPSPSLTIVAGPDFIRSGEVADVIMTITSDEDLNCSVYGTLTSLFNFTHTGASVTSALTLTTKTLTSAQEVQITCSVDGFSSVSTTETDRVNVVGIIQEI